MHIRWIVKKSILENFQFLTLMASFGNGDEVVMRLDQEGERTVIAYSLNGVGLGTAFDVHGIFSIIKFEY